MNGAFWTAEEDAILRDNYPRDPQRAIALLPHRSHHAVAMRALRIHATHKHRWTEREDAILHNNWGHLKLRAIAKLVGRSPNATALRVAKLGLGCGCPNGFEYITAAAKRTGYDVVRLRAILRAAGVRIARAECRPSAHLTKRHYVDPFDVDNAVALWHMSETVECAARRHGIGPGNLRKWLHDAIENGVEMPAPPIGYRVHWRVPTATIDAVIADRRRRESVMAAARRIGVQRQALTRWLAAAGVPRPKTKWWLVPPELADAVVAKRLSMKLPGLEPWTRRVA